MRKLILTFFLPLVILALIGYAFAPFITIKELARPEKIDSLYVRNHENVFLKELAATENVITPHFYYHPGQLGMNYRALTVGRADSAILKGWFIPGSGGASNPLLLMIHDLQQSKVFLLEEAKEFHDRGFDVAIFDLRAHGASSGDVFTFGKKESADVSAILDLLSVNHDKENFAVMGYGEGANIALLAAAEDPRIRVVIAQSPFDSLNIYLAGYAGRKYRAFLNRLFFDRMKNEIGEISGINTDEMIITKMADTISANALFIAAGKDSLVPFPQSKRMFNRIQSPYKEFWLSPFANHFDIEDVGGEQYFNKISVFIINSIPRKVKKTKYRKLALSPKGRKTIYSV